MVTLAAQLVTEKEAIIHLTIYLWATVCQVSLNAKVNRSIVSTNV